MLESTKLIPFQVSKWVNIPLLIDGHEMADLIQQIPSFKVYDVQRITSKEEGIYSPSYFLEHYCSYVEYLKKGEIPPSSEFRALFSSMWSVTEEALYSLPAEEDKRLIKPLEPSIQTKPNQIRYSYEGKIFRSDVFGSSSISWGIQIAFPHLFLDPKTFEATHTRQFPNMALFLAIQRWIRYATRATPFVVQNEKINSPIRLGKECFSWIHQHVQLKTNGIEIDRK